MVEMIVTRRSSLLAATSGRIMRAAGSAASPDHRARSAVMRDLVAKIDQAPPEDGRLYLRRGPVDAAELKPGVTTSVRIRKS